MSRVHTRLRFHRSKRTGIRPCRQGPRRERSPHPCGCRRNCRVVAHHEVMAGRHREDLGVVLVAVGDAVEHEIADPVRQRLLVARHLAHDPELVGLHIRRDVFLRHGVAVDVELAVEHLHAVAGKPDHALDEIFHVFGRVLVRHLEDDDVAAIGIGAEQPSMQEVAHRPGAERKRVAAVAIGEFLDEQVVADQQRVLHRSRGDVERLEQEVRMTSAMSSA